MKNAVQKMMLTIGSVSTLAVLISACTGSAAAKTPEAVMKQIRWLGQASVRIETGKKIIYIDPLFTVKDEKADIILITHLHQDHYVYDRLPALMKKSTVIIAPTALGFGNRIMNPGSKEKIGGITIEAVASYNTKKAHHPKSENNNGYVVTVDGVRIYHSGDTNLVPEMKDIHCDIAMVPVGQTFTFDSVDEAVEAVIVSGAKYAIPIHFGMYEGSLSDAQKFAGLLKEKGVTVEVRER